MRIVVYIHLIGWNTTNLAMAPDNLPLFGLYQSHTSFAIPYMFGFMPTPVRQNR